MGTLTSHVALLPPILKEKYKDAFWIGACNIILERLSGEGLMRELTYRRGVTVDDDTWITPPTTFRRAEKLYNPRDFDVDHPFVETDGKLMLTNSIVEEDADPYTATVFSVYALDSITVNIDDMAEDDFADYLLVITAGTLIDETIMISGNDASALGVTKLYFQHNSSSLLNGTKITAASLIHPDYYLALLFKGSYTDLTAVGDEVPINDKFEKQIMKTGLTMCAFERLHGLNSPLAMQWTSKFNEAIMGLRGEILSGPVHVKARPWAGLVDDNSLNTDEEEYHGK